jgi:hypothetical protein
LLQNIPKEHFTSYISGFFLIRIITERYTIRILARSAFTSENIPPEFRTYS